VRGPQVDVTAGGTAGSEKRKEERDRSDFPIGKGLVATSARLLLPQSLPNIAGGTFFLHFRTEIRCPELIPIGFGP